MWIGLVSLFPDMFQAVSDFGITRRAIDKQLLTLEFWNPRDFAPDPHKQVDDKPYGGGPGMLMKVQPLRDAILAAKAKADTHCPVIYMSPQGRQAEHELLLRLSAEPALVLVAGRYEGIDERLIEAMIDEEISIGDFVVTGGELPAMLLLDGMTRLIPGVLGAQESVHRDSFTDGLLKGPQYTRPELIDGKSIPDVLLSGNHQAIATWRKMQALGRTQDRRPELLRNLSEEEQKLLKRYQHEEMT